MGATPVRTCLACRRKSDKAELVRLVRSAGSVVVDAQGRAPGRGAYVCGRSVCVEAALRRGGAAIVRALRLQPGQASVDPAALRAGWESAVARPAVADGHDSAGQAGKRHQTAGAVTGVHA